MGSRSPPHSVQMNSEPIVGEGRSRCLLISDLRASCLQNGQIPPAFVWGFLQLAQIIRAPKLGDREVSLCFTAKLWQRSGCIFKARFTALFTAFWVTDLAKRGRIRSFIPVLSCLKRCKSLIIDQLSDRQLTDASDRAVDSRGVLVRANDRFQHFWRRTC